MTAGKWNLCYSMSAKGSHNVWWDRWVESVRVWKW